MKRLLAMAAASMLILTGCTSEPEIVEASSASQDSQEIQEAPGEVEDFVTEEDETWRAKLDHFLSLPKYTPSTSPQTQESQLGEAKTEEDSLSSSKAIEEEATLPPETDQNARIFETVTFVDNLDICKIPEYTWTGPHAKGFPIRNNDVPYQGKVTIAVVFIDFSNATSEGTRPLTEYQKELNNSISWSKFYSGGKMEYDIMLYPQWFRAPKEAQEYPIRKANVEHAEIQDWVSAADDYYDFSKAHFIYFVVPEKAHFELGADMYGMGKAITNDGSIERRVFTYYAPPQLIWSHMVHEVLHDQGFIGHGPANGSAFGIMMGQWYNSKSVLSWPSFMAGWLDGQDIVCIDARDGIEGVSIRLNSLDQLGASGGIKSIIIRSGDTTGSVVEYRTDGPFSTLRKEMHGVTVYDFDTSKPSNRCDSCGPQEYEDRKNWWNYVRRPNSFDASGNNNVNFGNGVIPTTSGFFIEVSDQSLISIYK